MKLRSLRSLIIACLWCSAGVLSAQVDYATATLQGAVLDPDGHPVPGAQVTVVNESTGTTSNTVTTSGQYLIPALVPGTYRVEAVAPAFATTVANGVVLTVGQRTQYDIHLRLTSVSMRIEVTAHIPMVQPDQTQQANIINRLQVENLPNVSRNFVESIYTLPGVVNSYAPTLQDPGVGTNFLSSGFSIGASNGRNNLVTIDGGENDYGSGAMRDVHVPIDSIQEFQVNRNAFEAEFGFTSGTAINMVTKSGTSQFHGSAGAYFHDWNTDGGNYFDKLAGDGAKPFEQSAIFSATLGGPIRKNNLFFFTAPEYQILDASTVQDLAGEQEFESIASQTNGYNGTCPNQNTPQQQVTQLCYLTQMADSGGPVAPLGESLLASPVFGEPFNNPILNALVKSNDGTFDGIPANLGVVRGLPGFSTPRGRYFNWVSRFDYSKTQDTLALRFALMREDDSIAPRPPYSVNEVQTDYTLLGSWTRVVSQNLINTVRAQVVPSNTASLQAPEPNGSEIDLGNEIQLGTPYSYPYFSRIRRFQFDDSLSWIKGNHIFKFGASWRPDDYSVSQQLWFGGEWEFTDGTFSILDISGSAAPELAAYNLSQGYPAAGPPSTNLTAVQSYLAGTPTLLLQANSSSNYTWSGWLSQLGLYAQDSWRALPQLTVNYGVRFDYDHNPDPVPNSARVSPRLGIAWVLDRQQTTVVRAGSGLFFAPTLFLIPFYANILGTSGKYVNQNALVAGLPPSLPFYLLRMGRAREQRDSGRAQPDADPSATCSLRHHHQSARA